MKKTMSKEDFIKNVSRNTVIRIVIPGLFFGFISIAFLLFAILYKELNVKQYYFFLYLFIFFFIFFLIFLQRIIYKNKVYSIKRRSVDRYYLISNKEYLEKISTYDTNQT